MSITQFNRDEMARWYAHRHLKADAGIREVIYLPSGADDREIRLIEINDDLIEQSGEDLEPIDFGVDIGQADGHKLWILDVTPSQWQMIQDRKLRLPAKWSMSAAESIKR